MKKKAAVLLINSLKSGGAERVVLTQAEELLNQGISVTILLVQNQIQYIPDPRIHIIPLTDKKEPSFFYRLAALPLLALKLNHILDKLYASKDMVLLAAHLPYCYILATLTKYKNKFIYVLHIPHFWMPFSNTVFFHKALKLLYNHKKIVCVSKGVEKELKQRYHIKAQATDTIYNPLNFKKIDEMLQDSAETVLDKPYILFCGRLNKQKRIDRLIKAYALGDFHKKYDLVILGIGELEEQLKKLAVDLGLENQIRFTGWSNNVYTWMANASLFVLSSDFEAFPMVLCEALYCNCPVVAVNCRYGPSEILTGELRQYLAKPSPKSLAKKMKLALESYPKNLKSYCKDLTSSNNIAQYLHDFKLWSKK